MACNCLCCGCQTCTEAQEGKCCCGGPSGTCCQPGEFCCSGVCQPGGCCVDCACDKCVKFSMTELGDLTESPPPEPTVGEYTALNTPDSCLEKEPCFDFEYVADPVEGQLGEGCGLDPWDWVCKSDDQNASVLSLSYGGEPCARLRCDANGDYFLDVCVFNTCFATDAAGAGRLTRKTYAVTLGEDGCPTAIGEELSSDVTDWARNIATGQWVPAADYSYDLDGDINGTPFCNQECWAEWPFDFQVCDVVEGVCDCNAFP